MWRPKSILTIRNDCRNEVFNPPGRHMPDTTSLEAIDRRCNSSLRPPPWFDRRFNRSGPQSPVLTLFELERIPTNPDGSGRPLLVVFANVPVTDDCNGPAHPCRPVRFTRGCWDHRIGGRFPWSQLNRRPNDRRRWWRSAQSRRWGCCPRPGRRLMRTNDRR